MKKLFTAFAALCTLSLHAQTTVVLQPNAEAGKDAVIFSGSINGNHAKNFGSVGENYAIAWTKNNSDYKIRSLIQFDLSSIPSGAVITSATLSLYYAPGSLEGNHFGFFGSNKAYLERIVTPWNENQVTWDSQPVTTVVGRVSLAGSTSVTQNYSGINVKSLVQDMVSNPLHSFGFMLKLQNETVYKKLVFASSDHQNASLHPRLVVVYSVPVVKKELEEPQMRAAISADILKIYPNPAKEAVNVSINSTNDDLAYISIYDLKGREMADQSYQLREGKNQFRFETISWTRGLYMVIVKTGGEMFTERLLLE